MSGNKPVVWSNGDGGYFIPFSRLTILIFVGLCAVPAIILIGGTIIWAIGGPYLWYAAQGVVSFWLIVKAWRWLNRL